jgi:AcrR family transcriptional regulator
MGEMADEVKRRSYDASGRRSRSDETRRRILESARQLLLEGGYRATKIADIARRAGVNVDTVYELVGRKPLIVRELIEQAISGTDVAVVAEERDYVKQIRATGDAVEKLRIYARAVSEIQTRMAPLHLALRDAASTEPEAAEVWTQISDRRAANMSKLVHDLAGTGRLRPGISLDEAADMLWLTNSAELYAMLTIERGWSPQRYERWLFETWRRLLLE